MTEEAYRKYRELLGKLRILRGEHKSPFFALDENVEAQKEKLEETILDAMDIAWDQMSEEEIKLIESPPAKDFFLKCGACGFEVKISKEGYQYKMRCHVNERHAPSKQVDLHIISKIKEEDNESTTKN